MKGCIMITSEKNIYIQETEIKPNKYAGLVLITTLFVIVSCWLLNELDIFRVGDREMRIGSIITVVFIIIPILMVYLGRDSLSNPRTKFYIISASIAFTFTTCTLLTFHTTIMLLFPILFAMLYRSKKLGVLATVGSFVCTVFTPIIGYLLHTWDIPLFEELILIATNGGVANIVGGQDAPSWLNVGKIVLYLVFPRLLIIGSASVLLFNNIKIGVDHVNNQILLHKISHIDALTGLYNQNTYKEVLETEKFKDKTIQIGIIFFDINGLKALNDAKGHEAGDLLLKRCAESVLAVCTSDNCIACRAGGDEFVIIVEGASKILMEKILVDWQKALDHINNENKVQYPDIVCSMAYGYELGDSYNIYDIVSSADTKMYELKKEMKEII